MYSPPPYKSIQTVQYPVLYFGVPPVFLPCSKAVGVGDVSASASLHLSCCVLLETCSFESVGHVALMCSSQRKWCSVYFVDIPWFASDVFLNNTTKFFSGFLVVALHHSVLVVPSCKRRPLGSSTDSMRPQSWIHDRISFYTF